jgi:hypothetical protein
MSKTSARKLPLWKVIAFSLTPALVVFVIVEGGARIAWAHLQSEAFARHINKVVNFVLGWGLIQIHAIIMAARARPER